MGATSNRVICRNEVFIEGVSVGQFESFTLKSDMRTLGTTAVLTLPLYSVIIDKMGNTRSAGRADARIRRPFKDVRVEICSEVDVYCWYEGFEKIHVFHGFIEHISEGFPSKLYLRDGSFILRFGNITEAWDDSATLRRIVDDCIDVAQTGFATERTKRGFTREVAKLTYSTSEQNVQAVTTPISFDNFASGRAPFEVIQYLMQLLVLYGGVDNENRVFIGAGVADSTRPIITLDTRYNVIERDITPVNGMFVDYDVKITGVLKNGKKYTATGGFKNTRSAESKSALNKTHGENFRGFCVLNTVDEIQAMADRTLAMLKGTRNKGTITTLLYPKCQLLDHVNYNDTIFDINDAKYYVIGYSFSADLRGFYQALEVTDKVFML